MKEKAVHFRSLSEIKERADDQFAVQAALLRKLIPGSDVQHVGATAIPGCITKGDVDIQVRVTPDSFVGARTALTERDRRHPGGFWGPDAASFEDESVSPPLGMHLTVKGGSCDFQWKFREVLLQREDLRRRYDDLKRRFQGGSYEEYCVQKEKFFDELRSTPEFSALRD